MNFFGDKVDSLKDFTPADIPAIPLSEGMIKRDNFFHNCWMLMKSRNPLYAEEMQDVELIISGYDPHPEPEKTQEEIDKEPKRTVL